MTPITQPMPMHAPSTYMAEDEEHLISAAKADRKHFDTLYNKYYEAILRFVYQRVETKDEAFDITQQAFINAMMALDKYEPRGFQFSAWLYRIALNEVNSYYRKNKKQRPLNVDAEGIGEVVAEIDDSPSPEKEEQLMDAMQQLDIEDVQLIEMRFFEKRPFKEMAEIKETGEAAIKMKVYRILNKLKDIIEAQK